MAKKDDHRPALSEQYQNMKINMVKLKYKKDTSSDGRENEKFLQKTKMKCIRGK